jgi:small subunit ribosomal protein S16
MSRNQHSNTNSHTTSLCLAVQRPPDHVPAQLRPKNPGTSTPPPLQRPQQHTVDLPTLPTIMVLRIRLARFGRKHSPLYNIVVAHARTARNSRPLEVLGTYNPIPQAPRPGDTHGRPWKDIKLDTSRARYWVGVGAQPSNTAWRLLSMVSRIRCSGQIELVC